MYHTSNNYIMTQIGILRDENTSSENFRKALTNISRYIGICAMENKAVVDVEANTPVEKGIFIKKPRNTSVIIPIMRAGLGMLPAMRELLPEAAVGYIAMARDEETLKPTVSYIRLPDNEILKNADIYVCDPMLATGGSLLAAMDILIKDYEIDPTHIKYVGIMRSAEGVSALKARYPEIDIYTTTIESLTKTGWLKPGLGDAGDRINV